MPVYNPQIATSRGQAGESDDTPSSGYNFANLYAMNRNNGEQQKQDLAGFQSRSDAITGKVDEATNSIREGDQEAADKQIGQAADDAKGLSNDTQGYSVSGSLQKKGIVGRQNRAATFYAGSAGQDAAQQARNFGNIYQSMLGVQQGMSGQVEKNITQNEAANTQKQTEIDAANKAAADKAAADQLAASQKAVTDRASADAMATKPAYDRLVSGGFMDPNTKQPNLAQVYNMFTGTGRPANVAAAGAAMKDIMVATRGSRIAQELGISSKDAVAFISGLSNEQMRDILTSAQYSGSWSSPGNFFDPIESMNKNPNAILDMVMNSLKSIYAKNKPAGRTTSGGLESQSTRSP